MWYTYFIFKYHSHGQYVIIKYEQYKSKWRIGSTYQFFVCIEFIVRVVEMAEVFIVVFIYAAATEIDNKLLLQKKINRP